MKDIKELYDVVVIGGGPAGLTAALYLARARYRVVVVEKEHFGGQITITDEVVNFPGVERTSGKALTETMRRQAQSFGAEFLLAEVTGLAMDGDVKTVQTSRGELHCFGVLLATGAHPRSVGFAGEAEFKGRGVAYCATCDGEFFTGKEVFVVGGGFAAAEESVFLTKYARHVTILIRGDGFTCAPAAAEAALHHEKITVVTHAQVEEVSGKDGLSLLKYRNTETGEVTEYRARRRGSLRRIRICWIRACDRPGERPGRMRRPGICCNRPEPEDHLRRLVCRRRCVHQTPAAGGDGGGRWSAGGDRAGALCRCSAEKDRPISCAAHGHLKRGCGSSENGQQTDGLFTPDMLSQLEAVFQKMASPLKLKLYLDDTPLSAELKGYMEELCALTDKLSLEMSSEEVEDRPCVRVCRADGSWTGLAFHGVPGGHEFTSFVLGLYNAAGPGQALDEEILQGYGP